jgi:hypothetical protein
MENEIPGLPLSIVNNTNMKKTKQIFIALFTLVVLLSGISLVGASSVWKNPTASAPGNNVDAPVNVGTDAQDKAGVLRVTGFRSFFDAIFDTKVQIGTTGAVPSGLNLLVHGKVGAGAYCDENGQNCVTSSGIAVSSTNTSSSSNSGSCSGSSKYDSGWVDSGAGQDAEVTLTHNLGTTDTVVFIEYHGDSNFTIEDGKYPVMKKDLSNNYLEGLYSAYYNKSATQISFHRYGKYADRYFRVVMWKIACM